MQLDFHTVPHTSAGPEPLTLLGSSLEEMTEWAGVSRLLPGAAAWNPACPSWERPPLPRLAWKNLIQPPFSCARVAWAPCPPPGRHALSSQTGGARGEKPVPGATLTRLSSQGWWGESMGGHAALWGAPPGPSEQALSHQLCLLGATSRLHCKEWGEVSGTQG